MGQGEKAREKKSRPGEKRTSDNDSCGRVRPQIRQNGSHVDIELLQEEIVNAEAGAWGNVMKGGEFGFLGSPPT